MKHSRKVRLGLLGFVVVAGLVVLTTTVRSAYNKPQAAMVSVATVPSAASSGLGVATQPAVTPSPSKSAKAKPVNVQVVLAEHMALLNARWKVAAGMEGGIGALEVRPQAPCPDIQTLGEGWLLCPADDQRNAALMYTTKRASELQSALAGNEGAQYITAVLALFYAEHVVNTKLGYSNKQEASGSIACWAGMSLRWFLLVVTSPDAMFQQWQKYLGQHNPAWKAAGPALAKGYIAEDWRDCLA